LLILLIFDQKRPATANQQNQQQKHQQISKQQISNRRQPWYARIGQILKL
jgi:hypothetical protein